MKISNFLKSIDIEASEDDIIVNLGKVSSTLRKVRSHVGRAKNKILSEEEVQTVQNRIDTAIGSATLLEDELQKLNSLLNLYQAQADQNIPNLEFIIDGTIYDYTSAYDATQFYSKDWFANSLFSEEAKVGLAAHILNAVGKYCSDNCETLEMVANREAEIMNYIRYPKPDDET